MSAQTDDQTAAFSYQRPSTLATRALVKNEDDGNQQGSEALKIVSASSADRTNAPGLLQVSGNGTSNYAAASGEARPAGLGRQPSWSMADKKREAAEQMLQASSGMNAAGYKTSEQAK